MTTNEKIQFYRKKLGLSQEELGQKLLVSRQTVSLWENGQTAPTIDNLIRLKEIFGVSVDELLGCENASEDTASPNESYKSDCKREDFDDIYKLTYSKVFVSRVNLLMALAVVFFVYLWIEMSGALLGFIAGVFALLLVQGVVMYIKTKKLWKSEVSKYEQCKYEFNVYDDYFNVITTRNDEVILSEKIMFSDIKRSEDTGKRLILSTGNRIFAIDKDDLISNSAFYKAFHESSDAVKTVSHKLSLTASVFFSLSFVFAVVSFAAIGSGFIGSNPWLLYFGLPVPIACIVLGFIVKKQGGKYLKNIFMGFLCVFLLLFFGSLDFLPDGISSDFDMFEYVSEATGISFPEVINQSTFDNDVNEYGDDDEWFIYSITNVEFEEGSADFFESSMAYDPRWLVTADEELNGLISIVENSNPDTTADRVLVYSENLQGYNAMPKETGTYYFDILLYYDDTNTMEIFECAYDVN